MITVHLHLIPFGEEDRAWPALRPYFDRIPKRVPGGIEPDIIINRARTRHMLLWAIFENGELTGAAATSEHEDERGPFAMLDAFAGDGWFRWGGDVLDDFEQRARRRGFDRIRGGGRLGWIRELKRRGYVADDHGFEKRLNDG